MTPLPEGISRYGVMLSREQTSHGIALLPKGREGFAVMSGVFVLLVVQQRVASLLGSSLPDKEFRYLRHRCYYSLLLGERPGHFCLAPYVAIGIGLYHHRRFLNGALHVVSEDPVSGFLLIVRTDRIVTAHAGTLRRGCDTDEYRRILGCSSI